MKARVLVLVAALPLAGCGGLGALPMALSAAGGLMTVLKDGMDIDVAWHQMTPGKTPVAAALTGALVIPPPVTAAPPVAAAPASAPFRPLAMAPVWSRSDQALPR